MGLRLVLFPASIAIWGMIVGAANLPAQDKIDIGGKMTCRIDDRKEFPVGDEEGHTIALNKSTGINISTGTSAFMDGAAAINFAVGDLKKGTGEQFGYVVFAAGPDSAFARWDHFTSTTMTPEGKPRTTFKGTFVFTRGTGKYAGIRGNGQYTGAFSSPDEYMVEWNGKYQSGK